MNNSWFFLESTAIFICIFFWGGGWFWLPQDDTIRCQKFFLSDTIPLTLIVWGGRGGKKAMQRKKCQWSHNNNNALIQQISQFDTALVMKNTESFNKKKLLANRRSKQRHGLSPPPPYCYGEFYPNTFRVNLNLPHTKHSKWKISTLHICISSCKIPAPK